MNINLQKQANTVSNNLRNAGFIVNEHKSNWFPIQSLTWLGFVIDTKRFTISVPLSKITDILDMLDSLIQTTLSNASVTARLVAQLLVGRLVACRPGVGNIAILMTISLQVLIANRRAWDGPLHIDSAGLYELQFWKKNSC